MIHVETFYGQRCSFNQFDAIEISSRGWIWAFGLDLGDHMVGDRAGDAIVRVVRP